MMNVYFEQLVVDYGVLIDYVDIVVIFVYGCGQLLDWMYDYVVYCFGCLDFVWFVLLVDGVFWYLECYLVFVELNELCFFDVFVCLEVFLEWLWLQGICYVLQVLMGFL